MVITEYFGSFDYWDRNPLFTPGYERSVIQIRIDYWFNLWEYVGVYIRNPSGVMLTGRTRCEKERDHG